MEVPKRIQLKGTNHFEEGVAGGTVTPGMLVGLNSDNEVVAHASAGAACVPAFALEDALQGRTIADNYVEGELVFYAIGKPGDIYYAWLALGEDIAVGDLLESEGTGMLVKIDSGVAIAEALDAIDLSDSSTDADSRIRVRLL